jgi:hypothetical protein
MALPVGGSNYINTAVVTISGTGIALNTPVQVVAVAPSYKQLVKVGTDKAILSFENGANINLYCVSVSGTVPSYGSLAQLHQHQNQSLHQTAQISARSHTSVQVDGIQQWSLLQEARSLCRQVFRLVTNQTTRIDTFCSTKSLQIHSCSGVIGAKCYIKHATDIVLVFSLSRVQIQP